MSAKALALLSLGLALGTVAAFVILLKALVVMPPALYLSLLAVAAVLGVAAVSRRRGWLTISACLVSVLVVALAGAFHFHLARVPAGPTAFVVGQPAPDFTLPDANGRPVRLADYRGRKPVVLVVYRGYW